MDFAVELLTGFSGPVDGAGIAFVVASTNTPAASCDICGPGMEDDDAIIRGNASRSSVLPSRDKTFICVLTCALEIGAKLGDAGVWSVKCRISLYKVLRSSGTLSLCSLLSNEKSSRLGCTTGTPRCCISAAAAAHTRRCTQSAKY